MTRTDVVPDSRLNRGSLRLNAAFYCSSGEDTRRLLQGSSLHLETIRDVSSRVFIGGRSRRLYVKDCAQGLQFISSSDMLLAELSSVPFVSFKQSGIDELILKRGWTLISRSGTIGNVVYVNTDLCGKGASEHIMRVVPNARVPSGYVYAWLASPGGVGLIKQNTFGSVIPTIEPNYVADLPIPRLGEKVEMCIHDLVENAATKRAAANWKCLQARALVYEVTGLPPYASAPVGRNLAGPRAYLIDHSELATRFEARYHDAFVHELEDRIRYNQYCGWTSLGECARTFLPDRGKWTDVVAGGIPLVSSGDMFLARPIASRMISAKLSPRATQLIVRHGDILVARSGQIYSILGDVVIAGRGLAGRAVTEDAIRICANHDVVHPGYLYAFLTLPDYGYSQLVRTAYGTSIPHLPVHELPAIIVPLPDKTKRDTIGDTVLQAIELRDEANDLENEAQQLLNDALSAASH